MATLVQAIYRTDVFGRQNQRVLTTSGSMQAADVFARRERIAATADPEPIELTVRLSVPGDLVEFTYTTFDRTLPPWASSVLQSLSERWGTRAGWDGYEALPTNRHLVVNLLNVLSNLMQPTYRPPQITPIADGGVQAEWHSGKQDLEIVVTADESPSYYYFDHESGAEEDAEVEPNYAHIQELIRHFT